MRVSGFAIRLELELPRMEIAGNRVTMALGKKTYRSNDVLFNFKSVVTSKNANTRLALYPAK